SRLLTCDVTSIDARLSAAPLQLPSNSPDSGLLFQVIVDSLQSPLTSDAEFVTPAAAVSIGSRIVACDTLPASSARLNETKLSLATSVELAAITPSDMSL